MNFGWHSASHFHIHLKQLLNTGFQIWYARVTKKAATDCLITSHSLPSILKKPLEIVILQLFFLNSLYISMCCVIYVNCVRNYKLNFSLNIQHSTILFASPFIRMLVYSVKTETLRFQNTIAIVKARLAMNIIFFNRTFLLAQNNNKLIAKVIQLTVFSFLTRKDLLRWLCGPRPLAGGERHFPFHCWYICYTSQSQVCSCSVGFTENTTIAIMVSQ